MRRYSGFTFLEMLLATAIFVLVGLASVAVLTSVTNADETSELALQRLQQLQRTMLTIERDFLQISARRIRVNGDEPQQNRLWGEQYLLNSEDHGVSFARDGWRNPGMILPRSELQPVAYRLQEGQLQRLFTIYPDAVTGTEPRQQVLLDKLDGFRLTYFDGTNWQESWQSSEFPQAVRVRLTDTLLGELEQIVRLPDGFAVQTEGEN